MKVKVLDTVVLEKDLPEHGLKKGDVGAVVLVYGDEALEVEFVTAGGRTRAVVTLKPSEVRPIGDDDLVTA